MIIEKILDDGFYITREPSGFQLIRITDDKRIVSKVMDTPDEVEKFYKTITFLD